MQLGDAVKIEDWVKKEWPKDAGLQDGVISVAIALGAAYGHSRAAHDGVDAILAQLASLKQDVATLRAQVDAQRPPDGAK